MADPKKRQAKTGRAKWTNLLVSRDTMGDIERLADLMKQADSIQQQPSKHRVVAVAVRESILRRAGRGD